VHEPLSNNVNVTSPVAVPADPDTIAWPVTAVPAATCPTTAPPCVTLVTVVLGTWLTVNDAHAPDDNP
jgi:hypothetical protein